MKSGNTGRSMGVHRVKAACRIAITLLFVVTCMALTRPVAAADTVETEGAPATAASMAAPASEPAPTALPVESSPSAAIDLPQQDATPTENPYGLAALWAQGDFVAKSTLAILAIMSVGSWFILLTKLWDQRSLFAEARSLRKKVWSTPDLREGIEKLGKTSVFRAVAEDGLEAATQHKGGLSKEVGLLDWTGMSLSRSTDAVAARLQGGLAFLATVGSTAPFVGLFGTVWGIYHALIAIGLAGQASIDKVAGPVGEALIMTAIGLAVAVPAVLGYNWLVRRNKAVLDALRRFAAEVQMRILSNPGNA